MKAFLVAVLVVVLASCTKKNPAVCCTTAVQCDEYGFDELTPCQGFEVCVDGLCEAPTCTTSSDCAEPSPYCVNTVCSATCDGDESCTGAGLGTYCALSGACVECLTSEQCTAPEAAVCSDTTNTCKPCAADDECASGICLAAEGVCIAESEAVFVAMDGADTDDCAAAAPCRTVAYALPMLSDARRVIRIVSADFNEAAGIQLPQDAYLDASGSRISRAGSGPVIAVSNNARVTIEGIRVTGAATPIAVTGVAEVSLHSSELGGTVTVSTGTLSVVASVLGTISCGSAELDVEESRMTRVLANDCLVAVRRSRLEVDEGAAIDLVGGGGGGLVFENSVVTGTGPSSRAFSINSPAEDVEIRFATLVVPDGETGSAPAISCSGSFASMMVTSSVIAWRSTAPVPASSTCTVSSSVFDSAVIDAPGTSNATQAFEEIFLDVEGGDYRPGAASEARQRAAAEDADVIIDYAGAARPQPVGTAADAGAFEVE